MNTGREYVDMTETVKVKHEPLELDVLDKLDQTF